MKLRCLIILILLFVAFTACYAESRNFIDMNQCLGLLDTVTADRRNILGPYVLKASGSLAARVIFAPKNSDLQVDMSIIDDNGRLEGWKDILGHKILRGWNVSESTQKGCPVREAHGKMGSVSMYLRSVLIKGRIEVYICATSVNNSLNEQNVQILKDLTDTIDFDKLAALVP